MSKTKISSKNEIPILSYKHKFTRLHSFTGFTLVELIVVITLLAILGTIAFLSLQGYSRSARDSVRIENLTSIKKGLDMFQVVSSTYPLPEGYITLTASGTPIGYQGFIKEQGESIAKISPGGSRDPLDSNIYTTYSVNTSKTRMQLMSFLEDGGSVSAFVPPVQRDGGEIFVQREGGRGIGREVGRNVGSDIGSDIGRGIGEIFPVAYASSTSDYTLRTPLTKGDSLGILLSSSTGTLNQPVQENYSVSSFTGVDVVNTSSGYIWYFNNKKKASGTGSALGFGYLTYYSDIGLVGYWNFDQGGGNVISDDSENGNLGNFIGSPMWSTGKILGGINTLGVGGYVRVPNSSSIDLKDQITIAFWIKDTGTVATYGSLIAKINMGTSGYIIQRNITTQDIYMRIDTSAGLGQNIAMIPNVLDGNWHHITYVLNQGGEKAFKDGVLIINGSYNPGNGFSQASAPLDIAQNLIGKIDEVRIYKRALSDEEIQTLYNTTK